MKNKKLSNAEFKQMINFPHRHVETDMDQWELWRLDSDFGKIYINVSMKSDGLDEAYTDLNHLLESK